VTVTLSNDKEKHKKQKLIGRKEKVHGKAKEKWREVSGRQSNK